MSSSSISSSPSKVILPIAGRSLTTTEQHELVALDACAEDQVVEVAEVPQARARRARRPTSVQGMPCLSFRLARTSSPETRPLPETSMALMRLPSQTVRGTATRGGCSALGELPVGARRPRARPARRPARARTVRRAAPGARAAASGSGSGGGGGLAGSSGFFCCGCGAWACAGKDHAKLDASAKMAIANRASGLAGRFMPMICDTETRWARPEEGPGLARIPRARQSLATLGRCHFCLSCASFGRSPAGTASRSGNGRLSAHIALDAAVAHGDHARHARSQIARCG